MKRADLLARVFGFNVLACPCGGHLRPIALANSPERRNLSPERVIASLADGGETVCEASTLRRILKWRAQSAPAG
jgi:hypothetical protein